MESIDSAVGILNGWLNAVFFADALFWDPAHQLPLIVAWLVAGAVFFTVRMGFINIRAFSHALRVTRGDYSSPEDKGEISHFQALATALSATVGLGNIAGVAIAVSLGGPGATFWMIVAGLLGMSAKFTEVTLGQIYREIRPDGHVLGGPMEYLSRGLAGIARRRLGKALAVLFSMLCIGASLGGGGSFQVNQSLNAVTESLPWLVDNGWAYGAFMVVAVALVVVGGIRSIATAASRIVPAMVLLYLAAVVYILVSNFPQVPSALATIVTEAFAPQAAFGGLVGVVVQGFRRAAFSNEAGAGSAAIAHSAARSRYPVREGIVALLEPFVDTVVVCTMTSLVIVITGAYADPANIDLITTNQGAALTSRALGNEVSWFPYLLSLAVVLFAYSTMISWFYYGERCWSYLFGEGRSRTFQTLFLIGVFLGSIVTSQNVLQFGDTMLLGMAFPNLLGVYLLHGQVRRELDSYWTRYRRGELEHEV